MTTLAASDTSLFLPALLLLMLAGLIALGTAGGLVIGGGRLAEATLRFVRGPTKAVNMNRIGDGAHRHQIPVHATTVTDAWLPGIGLFGAGVLMVLLGPARRDLGLVDLALVPLAAPENAVSFHLAIPLVLLAASWPLVSSLGAGITGRAPGLFLRIPLLTLVTGVLAAIATPTTPEAPLLLMAFAAALTAPIALACRAFRLFGAAGLLWLPAALSGWVLGVLAVAVFGPLAGVLRRLLGETGVPAEIGSGRVRALRLAQRRDSLPPCFAADTLEGAIRSMQ